MGQPLEQVPQTALQTVHHVGFGEARQPESSALRAESMGPEVEAVRPRHMLLSLAQAALIDRQIGKPLGQRAVDPPHLASAINALSHGAYDTYVVAQFAEPAQLGSQ
jgi:hypothetical protein